METATRRSGTLTSILMTALVTAWRVSYAFNDNPGRDVGPMAAIIIGGWLLQHFNLLLLPGMLLRYRGFKTGL
jgi:hypothetical protein